MSPPNANVLPRRRPRRCARSSRVSPFTCGALSTVGPQKQFSITWILYGAGVKVGHGIQTPANTYDTAVTIAHLLAIPPHAALDRETDQGSASLAGSDNRTCRRQYGQTELMVKRPLAISGRFLRRRGQNAFRCRCSGR